MNIIYVSFISVEPEEIRRLGKRFRKLDLDKSGSLSSEEFMSVPELQQNPIVQRVIAIFDADCNGEIDFKGFAFKISLKISEKKKIRRRELINYFE